MSSLPARMAKRALKANGYTREWAKSKYGDEAFPHRVLNPEGRPVALTWSQATTPKPGRTVRTKQPPKPRRAIKRADLVAAREKAAAVRKARVNAQSKVLAKRQGGFRGHYHGKPGMLPEPRANLSRNHPDYGCTPAEHAAGKAGRAR